MSIIDKIVSGFSGNLLDGAGKIIDSINAPKEEKDKIQVQIQELLNSHIEKMTEAANKELELQLADVQSARDDNEKIQESPNASWISKNLAYMLDLIFVSSFVAMLGFIIFKQVPTENKEIFYTAFGLLGSYVSTVINFHRGTSKGSEDKSKQLHDLAMK